MLVNGEPIEAEAGSYSTIRRAWKNGDVIALDFDMRVRILYAKDVDPNAKPEAVCHFSLSRGPITLARDSALGDDLSVPVTAIDTDGYVSATATKKASFPVEQEYEISAEDGAFTVVDYASAGQSWKQDMPITVWIKTK